MRRDVRKRLRRAGLLNALAGSRSMMRFWRRRWLRILRRSSKGRLKKRKFRGGVLSLLVGLESEDSIANSKVLQAAVSWVKAMFATEKPWSI